MHHQIINTARNTIYLDSQFIQIIPKNDRLSSPLNDKLIERRSKSIPHSQLSQLLSQSILPSPITISPQPQPTQQPITLQIDKIVYQQFKSDLAKYIQQNLRLKAENQILSQNNTTLSQQINQQHQSHQTVSHNRLSQSYCNRLKSIQQHIALYQLQSQANIIYSQCLLEISRCLTKQQLTIHQLRSLIKTLMSECDTYRRQIQQLSQVTARTEHNMTEEIQKLILDLNQAIFSNNDLEITIFDLTNTNNSLQAQIADLRCRVEQQDHQIKKLHMTSSRLNSSRVGPRTQNSLPQLKLNLQHYQRQNQHLKTQLQTLKTKINHYHGSELNYKQQITRLNGFINELNMKWNVEFEHNGVLQQERQNHLREVVRLGGDVQRWRLEKEEMAKGLEKVRGEIEVLNKQKRGKQQQLQLALTTLKSQQSTNFTLATSFSTLQHQRKSLHLQLTQSNSNLLSLTRTSQQKQNSYLLQLNTLRQQIYQLQTQVFEGNNSLIRKEEEMRQMREEERVRGVKEVEWVKEQGRMELEREKGYGGERVMELEQRVVEMERGRISLEQNLKENKKLVDELEREIKRIHNEYQQNTKTRQNTFQLQKQTLLHTKILLQNQLQFSYQHIHSLQSTLNQIKQTHTLQSHSINSTNQTLIKKLEEMQIQNQTHKRELVMMGQIERERDRLWEECGRLEGMLGERGMEVDEFMRRMGEEERVRREIYEEEIGRLRERVERGEEEKIGLEEERRGLEREIDRVVEQYKEKSRQVNRIEQEKQRVNQQNKRTQKQNNITIIEALQLLISQQLLNLKNQFIDKMTIQYSTSIDLQLDILLTQYQHQLTNLSNSISKFIENNNHNLEKSFGKQLYSLVTSPFSQQKLPTRSSVGLPLAPLQSGQILNQLRTSSLQTQLNTLQSLFLTFTNQFPSKAYLHQIQTATREIQSLKHANQNLNYSLMILEQNVFGLKEEVENQRGKYQKLRREMDGKEDVYGEKERGRRELERRYDELVGRLAMAEERTVREMGIGEGWGSRVEINVGTEKEIRERGRQNPQVIIQDGQTMVRERNKIQTRGMQVIVNVIQKESDNIQSPRITRNIHTNSDTFGVLPYMLNQEPNSPTHRVCLAGKKLKSPLFAPTNGPHKNQTFQKQSNFIKEEYEFVARNKAAKIKQIPYIPITGGIQEKQGNRIQTIKASTSQPIIHFPDASFEGQRMRTSILQEGLETEGLGYRMKEGQKYNSPSLQRRY